MEITKPTTNIIKSKNLNNSFKKRNTNTGDTMKIRLGYACISETLNTNYKTYTYSNYIKEQNKKKLEEIITSNLFHLQELLIYNNKNNIHFFRISSNLIPLATKKEVDINYYKNHKKIYQALAIEIKKNNMRVDFHPSEYCVLNSTKKEVVNQSIDILKYHYNLLMFLDTKEPLLVLHIGSKEFGKEKAITRFINNFKRLPKEIQNTIAIENDDKSFNVEDCLTLSEKTNIPVILDYHHHQCNPSNKNLEELLPRIIKTWKITPKMHFSSPKSKLKKEYRSHNDYIDVKEFIKFINILKKENKDIDIMLEAKKKDEALFRLVRELKYQTNIKFLDETSFMI